MKKSETPKKRRRRPAGKKRLTSDDMDRLILRRSVSRGRSAAVQWAMDELGLTRAAADAAVEEAETRIREENGAADNAFLRGQHLLRLDALYEGFFDAGQLKEAMTAAVRKMQAFRAFDDDRAAEKAEQEREKRRSNPFAGISSMLGRQGISPMPPPEPSAPRFGGGPPASPARFAGIPGSFQRIPSGVLTAGFRFG